MSLIYHISYFSYHFCCHIFLLSFDYIISPLLLIIWLFSSFLFISSHLLSSYFNSTFLSWSFHRILSTPQHSIPLISSTCLVFFSLQLVCPLLFHLVFTCNPSPLLISGLIFPILITLHSSFFYSPLLISSCHLARHCSLFLFPHFHLLSLFHHMVPPLSPFL